MHSALETPLDFAVLRKAEESYLAKRHDPIWSVEIHNRRTLPVYGVADAFIDGDELLSRDTPFSGNELMATLELGYMLRLVITTGVSLSVCCTCRAAAFLSPLSR